MSKNLKQATIDLCAPFMVTPSASEKEKTKKKRCSDGQMTLTQMYVESDVQDTKKPRLKSTKEAKSPQVVNLLDTVPLVFPEAGDLVEMAHPNKSDYTVFGLVQSTTNYILDDDVIDEQVEVKWQKKSRDGELNAVMMEEISTVTPKQLHVLAKRDAPLDSKRFNWWKASAVDRGFDFDEDRHMWTFKKCLI